MKYFSILFFLCFHWMNTYAQIGINTETPQSTLDVRGDITVRDKIYLNETGNTLGDPGKKGQVLISQGENNPPIWKSLNIPIIKPGDFYIIFTEAYSDAQGLSFANNETIGGTTFYDKGDLRSDSKFDKWKDISGLTKEFNVYNTNNKVYISYEAVVHISGQGSGYVDFACGVFINDQLQGVRTNTIKQISTAQHPFHTFLMIVIADNINVGTNEVKVSCARLRNNNYTGQLGIGRAIQTNINNFVAQSSVKIDIYEMPEIFIPVIN